MWGFRKDAVLNAPKAAADAIGKLIPGPLGAPFRDQSKPTFDPNTVPTVGFQPMSFVAPLADSANKGADSLGRLNLKQIETTDRFGALKDQAGLVSISFDGLGHGGGALNDNFKALSGGSVGFKNALDILTATAIGAARALAQVALSGGMTAGGGSPGS